jgi:cell division protein FtsB
MPRPRSGAAPRAGARYRPAPTGVARSEAEGSRGRPTFTGRAALLALVLVVLGMSYAYPLRTWLDQRAELADLRAEQVRLEQQVTDLAAQQHRWQDPAYVKAQARERLGFVMPGETGYIVIDGKNPSPIVPEEGLVTPADIGSWWQRLWGTVEAAGAPNP